MTKVRFAPSPTGHLHIGGVRTALFNYLFSRNQDGEFVLRIEDTDVQRSSLEMAEEIIKGMKWLGLDWDGQPYYQSHHFESYKKIAEKLVEEKKAYRCFCTTEELEHRKKNNQADIIKYDRHCLNLDEKVIEKKLSSGEEFVIRFMIPQGKTAFKDRIHKEMEIDNSQLDDYVLLKSDGSPTYHLSVVADDSKMEITDVVRGDDHISNTFKQLLLYRALELKAPRYAHLPLILGADKKKLSKRHGETSILEFKKQGYLPSAILTYLSQLSWLPGDDKKIFTLEELVKKFSMQKLSKNSPVFDYDKLRFLNSRAIQECDPGIIYNYLSKDKELDEKLSSFEASRKNQLIELVKPRMKTLEEFKDKFIKYLIGGLQYNQDDLEKLKNSVKQPENFYKNLNVLKDELKQLDNFNGENVEKTLRQCSEKLGIKAAELIHPSRFALTSETVSPSIFSIFEFFGREESIKRLELFLSTMN